LNTQTLTASTEGDDFTGTDADEFFVAASTSRLQDVDVLDGGLGTDTLTAKLNSATAHDATLNDIEILNFEVLGASTLLANQFTGVEQVNITGSAVLTLTSAAAGIAYSVAGDDAGLTLTQAGTDATTNAIAVTLGEGDLGVLTLGATTGVDFETITLNATGTTSATLTEAGTPDFTDANETITVTADGDFTLNMASTTASIGAAADSVAVGDAVIINGSGVTGTFTLDIGDIGTGDNNLDFFSAEALTGVDRLVFGTNSGTGTLSTIEHVASGTTVVIDNTEAVTDTVAITQRASATDDTLIVSLAHATAGSSIDISGLTVDGFETVTINSAGTDSSTTTVTNVIDVVAGLSTDTTLLLTGDKALTLTGVEATFTTITSTNTTGVDVTVDTGGALAFTGGTGDDRLELDTVADLTIADTAVGGDGTDTLAFSAVPSAVTAAQLARVSGFEVLEFEATNTVAGALGLNLQSTDFNTVYFNGTLDTNDVVTTLSVNDGFTLKAGVSSDTDAESELLISVLNAENAGTDNTVNFELVNVAADDGANEGFGITGVENLNILVSGDKGTGGDVWTLADVHGTVLQDITISSTNTTAATASDSLTITAVESTLVNNIDASAFTGVLTITGLATALIATGATIEGGSGVDNITGGAGADVINGNAGADVIIGGAGADAISGGEGADTITGGLGSDTITLTETTRAIDTVVLTTGGAVALTTIVDFDVRTAAELGDNVDIDLSDLNGIVTAMRTGDGTVLAAAAAPVLTTITGAYDMAGSNFDILVLSGDFADTSAVETALEVGGSRALTSDDATAGYLAKDAFLVMYDDGTDSYLGYFSFGTDPGDDETFTAGDLTVVNLVKFTGIADATTFVSNNFDIVA